MSKSETSKQKIFFNIPVSPDSRPVFIEILPINKGLWEKRNDPDRISIERCLSSQEKTDSVFRSGARFGRFLARNTDSMWFRGFCVAIRQCQIETELEKKKAKKKQEKDSNSEKSKVNSLDTKEHDGTRQE
jgi:hypothetical protein